MLIKHTPDAYEKLQILGAMARDDILSPSSGENSKNASRVPYSSSKPVFPIWLKQVMR